MLRFWKQWFSRLFVFLLLCSLGGCFSPPKKVTVGRDLTWFPNSFGLFTPNVNAFVNAVSTGIGSKERLNVNVINLDWIHLTEYLIERKITGIFTCVLPGYDSIDEYEFSDPLLLTGPVLVVKKGSLLGNMEALKGRTIGAYLFDSSSVVAQKIPDAVIRTYDHIPTACELLITGTYDALLIPSLNANNLISTVYDKELEIVSEPLTAEGIRLMTIKQENSFLITAFNHGLKKLQDNGTYSDLKKQYAVP